MRSFQGWYLILENNNIKGPMPCHMSMGWSFKSCTEINSVRWFSSFLSPVIADYAALCELTFGQAGATIRVSNFHPAMQVEYSSTSSENTSQSLTVGFTKSGKHDWRKPVSPRLCNSDRPRFSSTFQNLSPNTKISHHANLFKITKNEEQKDVSKPHLRLLPSYS